MMAPGCVVSFRIASFSSSLQRRRRSTRASAPPSRRPLIRGSFDCSISTRKASNCPAKFTPRPSCTRPGSVGAYGRSALSTRKHDLRPNLHLESDPSNKSRLNNSTRSPSVACAITPMADGEKGNHMAGCRAAVRRTDCEISRDGRPLPANDDAQLPFQADIAAFAIPGRPALASCPANDDWIEEDLPVSINVLADEIMLLDQHLRANILALFD